MKAAGKIMVERGANINAKDKLGRTPLHTAVLAEDYYTLDLVEYLLSKKAKINIKDKEGKTPLELALSRNNSDAVELLKRYGATARLN
jgi:ankyrin repeat protein